MREPALGACAAEGRREDNVSLQAGKSSESSLRSQVPWGEGSEPLTECQGWGAGGR